MKSVDNLMFKKAIVFAVILDIIGIASTATFFDAGTVLAYCLGVAIASAFVLNEIFGAKVGNEKMRKALLVATIFGILDGGVPLFVTGR